MTEIAPPTPPPSETPLGSPRAAAAVTTLFAVNGMLLGGYGGSLPSLRARLGLDATQIAVLLFSAGLAAIGSMQFGGRLSDTKGARKIVLVSLPILIAGCIVVGFAPSYAAAILGALLIGLGNGSMDVAMNALGVQVETARRRPIMSFFHAFFSVGNFVGAGAVLLISRALSITGAAIVLPVMLTLSAVGLVVLAVLFVITPPAVVAAPKAPGARAKIPRIAWLLGVMALGYGLSEGTAIDWSSLHVTDVARVDSTTGSLGLAAVSGFMVIIRFLGDRLVVRFGRRAVVRFGALSAAIGYLTVTLVSALPLLLAGWALVGFGVGMVAPQVYAVAGHIGGGRILALVVTFGYAAFLAGPAVIGVLVRHVGIHHAMAFPAFLAVSVIGLASIMPDRDEDLGANGSGRAQV